MKAINEIEQNSLKKYALFLTGLGIIIFILGLAKANHATTVIGIYFTVLSLSGLGFIWANKSKIAILSWALLTPIMPNVCLYFFTVHEPNTLFSYGYMYIAGLVFCTYSLKKKNEFKYVVISAILFYVCFITYDILILKYSFSRNPEMVQFYVNDHNYFRIIKTFHFASICFFIYLFQKNRYSVETAFTNRIDKLNKFSSNLISSSKNKLIIERNFKGSLEEILVNTTEILDVSRMSIWEYSPLNKSIKNIVTYDKLNNIFSYEGELFAKDYPLYFDAISTEKTIVAPFAKTNEYTKEFNSGYLDKFQINSMLDTPFYINGEFKGILCFEEQREHRIWDEMDLLYSISISQLVSISYYWAEKRNHYSEIVKMGAELKQNNALLNIINQKVSQINEELNINLKIKEQNITELQDFYKDLSIKNAHIVKAPLSRILGLIQLYNTDSDISNKSTYINYIEEASKELNSVVHEITTILNKSQIKN